jgi:hypothetical protein
MYKSIMLSNREHTREVICSAMLKHGLEGSPDDFTLAQMLPDKGKSTTTNHSCVHSKKKLCHEKDDWLSLYCLETAPALCVLILISLKSSINSRLVRRVTITHS